MGTEHVNEEANRTTKPLSNGFIPKLMGKKVVIRLVSGGQPVTGTVENFLQAHIAQLIQSISQLALKPGDEEIKKKGWWQFWK